jgi:hypothetical protein
MDLREFVSKTIREFLNENEIDSLKNLAADKFYGKIEGRFLTDKQAEDLQREIESNYVNGDMMQHFSREKNDLRMGVFNYENPIAEKDLNGVNLKITPGLIRDNKKTYLLYANGKIVGEFYSVDDIKLIIRYMESNLVSSVKSIN